VIPIIGITAIYPKLCLPKKLFKFPVVSPVSVVEA